MKKILFSSLLALGVFTAGASSTSAATTGTVGIDLTVVGGDLSLASYPGSLSFQDYSLGNNDALLTLKDPFVLAVEDFSGTNAGWNLSMTISELRNGTETLRAPSLLLNYTGLVINDVNGAGNIGVVDTSPAGTFTTGGTGLIFGTASKLISANASYDSASKHFFTFPRTTVNLGFKNTTKAGSYTGTVTYLLATGP